MPQHIVLVDDPKLWSRTPLKLPIVSVRDYLTGTQWQKKRDLHVTNLSRHLGYHSMGYYASLLAEARDHRMIPSVRTLQDLSSKTLYGPVVDDLDTLVEKALGKGSENLDVFRFEIVISFGACETAALRPLARKLYEAFPVPLLRVEFKRDGRWRIRRLKPTHFAALNETQQTFFLSVLDQHLRKRWRRSARVRQARFDIAILHNPDDPLPPSNRTALANFLRAARAHGMAAELITRHDFTRLAEYDALFIRETTALNHHTYRFARKASAEGMVVIDDPDSIRRCVNKIFLNELLTTHKIPTPTSVILAKGELDHVEAKLGYPLILKIPDGSFSRGMHKANDRAALEAGAADLFSHSQLILAQAYTYTEFDWRVGILDGEPLYVCRYYMSRGHWQIINHSAGKAKEGGFDALPLEHAPKAVIEMAVRAAKLIGSGLYGVDLKETPEGIFVIEINDNPSIEAGVEDKIPGRALYHRIMGEFLKRLEARTR